jgi:hypothetical protein
MIVWFTPGTIDLTTKICGNDGWMFLFLFSCMAKALEDTKRNSGVGQQMGQYHRQPVLEMKKSS